MNQPLFQPNTRVRVTSDLYDGRRYHEHEVVLPVGTEGVVETANSDSYKEDVPHYVVTFEAPGSEYFLTVVAEDEIEEVEDSG